jgi:hypothetical protein
MILTAVGCIESAMFTSGLPETVQKFALDTTADPWYYGDAFVALV